MGARIRRKVKTHQVAKRESETRRAVVNLHQRIVAIERWIQANAPEVVPATKLTVSP